MKTALTKRGPLECAGAAFEKRVGRRTFSRRNHSCFALIATAGGRGSPGEGRDCRGEDEALRSSEQLLLVISCEASKMSVL